MRGTRRSSADSMTVSGSKSSTCAATEDLSPLVSIPRSRTTPLRPAMQARAKLSAPIPLGLTTPIPVMTTRRR